MNHTNYYFAKYYQLIDQNKMDIDAAKQNIKDVELAVLEQTLTKKDLTVAKQELKELEIAAERKLIAAAVAAMDHAIAKDDYSLTIDDIKDILDCDDRFVADYVIEHVDYIDAPKHAGTYFYKNLNYSCVDQIRLFWKKVFISKSSFINFLIDHTTCRYVYSEYNDAGKLILVKEDPVSLDQNTLNGLLNRNIILNRRCNLGHLIEADKFYRFKKRILSALIKQRDLFTVDRLKQEVAEIKRLTPNMLRLQVRSKEITDYINKNAHMEYTIQFPGTVERTAKRPDIADQAKLQKQDTVTVLYCFGGVIREDIETMLDAVVNQFIEGIENVESPTIADMAKRDFAIIKSQIEKGITSGTILGSGNAEAVDKLNTLLYPLGYLAYIPHYADYCGEIFYCKLEDDK